MYAGSNEVLEKTSEMVRFMLVRATGVDSDQNLLADADVLSHLGSRRRRPQCDERHA
jgi:hypothetical protein